jgi:hypothetical protein
MSAGKIRGKILSVLWAAGTPVNLQRISEKIGLDSSSTMGYLLGLIKAEYVAMPQKHYYTITNQGKQAIGLPPTDKKLATKIMRTLPQDKAFYFYYDLDQYSGVYADSLKDFVDKIQNVELQSIEFHIPRKDFECWISSLGDVELSKKIELLRMSQLSGERLQRKLQQIVKSRCDELTKLAV